MYRLSVKPVLVGLVIGVLLIAIPFFLLKAALFFLLFAALFRFVGRRLYYSRHQRRRQATYGLPWHPAFADTIRTMSEEDYGTFRQKLADDRPYAWDKQPTTTIEIQ